MSRLLKLDDYRDQLVLESSWLSCFAVYATITVGQIQ